ncbi:MAG: hypothetical protein M3445_09460 [Actinomycetota bacterium]|nr:hypothetical protein [Actinomycetota bacterium]
MAKRRAFLHIGLGDGSGDFIDGALEKHGHALAALGVRRPAKSADEMFRASIEILRAHKEWGYKRAEVEGAWSGICRRAHKGKDTVVFSQPLLAAAAPAQIDLLLDTLAGFEIHVVVTVRAPDAWTVPGEPTQDLGPVLDRWSRAVRKPHRLHVIVDADDSGATWTNLGRVVGFGTASLSVSNAKTHPRPGIAPDSRVTVLRALGQSWTEQLTHSEHDVVGDVAALVPTTQKAEAPQTVLISRDHALTEALREVERLSRRNESLELRIGAIEQKPRKRKGRLSQVA